MPTEKAHGIQLAKMCEALVECGVDLTLVLPRYERRSEYQSIREAYRLRVDIPVIWLPVIALARHTALGFNVSAFSFALRSFLFGLTRRLRGEQAILYALDMDQFSFSLLPLSGLPVFLEAHGEKRPNLLTRYFFCRVRGIIANSGGTRDALVRDFNVLRERTLIAPNGIDLAHFGSLPDQTTARKRLLLPKEAKIALYIGRFYDWKGLDIMAEAAKQAPDIGWYLVGGDDDAFRSATGVSNVPPNLHCLGSKQFGEIPLWLSVADVLLVLGTKRNEYSWTQTSPMKLFEYMAAKRPIVASGTPANREIVSEKEAFLYEPDNTESLVAAVRGVVKEDRISGGRVENALRKVATLTWQRRVEWVQTFITNQIKVI
jgi:glycosyltransferase involved in cell wall biosynthesis